MTAVVINGAEAEVPNDGTVLDAVALVGIGPDDRGVAVAVDEEIVPRGRWTETALSPGARIEIVRATAGG